MVKSFLAYWTRLRMKNRGLGDDDGKMTITVESFKGSLQKAYGQGSSDRKDVETSLGGVSGDLFGDLFRERQP
jgi:hypothetical protein